MCRIRLLVPALLFVLPLLSTEAFGQGKDKKKGAKDGVKATPQEYAQLQNVKELTGKLGFADDKAISLRVEISHMVPNPAFKPGAFPTGTGGANLNRLYQEILRDQADIARARNPVERQRRMQELQRDMQRFQLEMAKAAGKAGAPKKGGNNNGPFKTVTEVKEFDLDVADKLAIRWLNPPFQYDDKGEIKKYSKEELTQMKGKDSSLPGYSAKLDELAPGQTVKVLLKAPAKEAKKKNPIDEAEGVASVSRPSVTMILILEESNLPVTAPKKGKK